MFARNPPTNNEEERMSRIDAARERKNKRRRDERIDPNSVKNKSLLKMYPTVVHAIAGVNGQHPGHCNNSYHQFRSHHYQQHNACCRFLATSVTTGCFYLKRDPPASKSANAGPNSQQNSEFNSQCSSENASNVICDRSSNNSVAMTCDRDADNDLVVASSDLHENGHTDCSSVPDLSSSAANETSSSNDVENGGKALLCSNAEGWSGSNCDVKVSDYESDRAPANDNETGDSGCGHHKRKDRQFYCATVQCSDNVNDTGTMDGESLEIQRGHFPPQSHPFSSSSAANETSLSKDAVHTSFVPEESLTCCLLRSSVINATNIGDGESDVDQLDFDQCKIPAHTRIPRYCQLSRVSPCSPQQCPRHDSNVNAKVECRPTCHLAACSNQVFKALEVSDSLHKCSVGIKGTDSEDGTTFGLFAAERIPKHETFGEYLGELNESKNDLGYEIEVKVGVKRYYLDASQKGNKTRFMNHSCSPNCRIRRRSVNGIPRIAFMTTRDIDVGTELTWDYGSCWWTKCQCGSSNCRKP